MARLTRAEREQLEDAKIAAYFRRQIFFWLAAGVFFIVLLYLFRSILLPFVAGMVLAYFLDPVADRLEKAGMSRLVATLTIVFGFIVAFVLALMLIVPVLATQLVDFVNRIPEYVARLQELIASINPDFLSQRLGLDFNELRNSVTSILQQGAGFLAGVLQSVLSSGLAFINLAGLIVITPVVAFYMLLDWDHMVEKVDNWIPRDHLDTVRRLGTEVNTAIAGFIRGQGTVCLLLGAMYAAGLTLTGLNFGLLIGLFAGLISFIPYIGSMIGLVLALAVAIVQFWPDWVMLAAVAGVFIVGQFIEGNILQPKLVGQSVGLHPVWLMFALFAFGTLFGFVGLLVAVPAAAAVGVLVRFAIGRYMASPLYRGHGH
jgi:predicted PurR-regulated permease PerM